MHDRLGERVSHFPRNQEELEEMANARFLDEIHILQRFKYSSCGTKGSSLSASLEDKASPMVSRRVDKDAEEKDAVGTSGRFVQRREFPQV